MIEADVKKSDLEILFEVSPDLQCVVGKDGYFRTVNPAFNSLLGYSVDEILSKRFIELIHPDDFEATLRKIKKQQSDGAALSFENRYRHKDGQYFTFSWSIHSVPLQGDLYAVGRNITDTNIASSKQNLNLLELRASGDEYRSIVEGTDDLINVLGPDGVFKFVNHSSEIIYGKTPKDCIGLSYVEFVHPDDLQGTIDVVQGWVKEKRTSAHYQNRQISADGTIRDVSWNIALHYDGDGEGETIIAIGRDVTERKRAEEALRESEARLSLHMQNTPVGAITWDKGFHCTEWNKAAERIFGYSADEAFGHHAVEIVIPAVIRNDINEIYAALLKQEGGSRSTNENITKDGRAIICDWYNTPILGRDGEVIGVASLVQDITDRKHTEAQLIKAKEEAEKASRAKSDFLAAMSHELRTPLNAITGFSQMIQGQVFGDVGNEKYIEYADDIVFSANHLISLVSDILDLSKIEADEVVINPSTFSLSEAVHEAVNLTLKSSKRPEDSIQINIDETVDSLTTDLRSFRQIMINLLSNAGKYTDDGKLIKITATKCPDHGTVLEVSDQGIGIAPEDLDHVLEPFGQSRSSPDLAHSGTGLGLTISKGLMALNQGTFQIESKLGEGTTIILKFPDLTGLPGR